LFGFGRGFDAVYLGTSKGGRLTTQTGIVVAADATYTPMKLGGE
jgi:hypothetical protein